MRFQCPYCHGIVAVDNTDMGTEVQCGHCQEIVTVPSSRVATGAVIADFIILQELGRGGMGVVYLSHQISLDRPAALKVLSDNYANNAEFVVGFIKEARAAAKLNHPHIVQAYAVGEDEGIFYFAMENIDGETMKAVLKREKIIPVDRAVQIIQQVAEALDYAWKEQRLIHRDIKPDNIMLTSNGRAKLADLGLAKVAGEKDENEDEDEVMGTPQYISPEHLTGAPMDVRSDIYSLGATFYHFVTGRFPFDGKTATEVARKHLEEPLVPPMVVNPSVPASVSAIIEKMMAKNVKDRYQDAEELLEDLRAVRKGQSPAASPKHTMRITHGGTQGIRLKTPTSGRKSGIFTSTNAKVKSTRGTSSHTTNSYTGPISTVTTNFSMNSTDTLPGVKTMKHQHEAQSKIKFIAIVFSAIGVLGIVAALIYFIVFGGGVSKTQTPPASAPIEKKEKKEPVTTAVTEPGKEPQSTAYTIKANEILDFASKNPDKNEETLKNIEEFFINFPDQKYNVESKKFQELLDVYAKGDEMRIIEARSKMIEEAKRRIEEQRRAEREKKEAEARERREKEEARLLAKRQAEERKQRLAKEAKEAANYAREVEKQQAELAAKAIDLVSNRRYSEAVSLFDDAEKAKENAANRPDAYRKTAAAHAEWAANMKKQVGSAEKIANLFQDSGNELKGTQIVVKGDLGTIVSVKGGVITASMSGGKRAYVKFSSLDSQRMLKLVRRVSNKVQMEDGAFAFFLMNGDFYNASVCASTAQEKKIYSDAASAYLKMKLTGASPAVKKELERKYRRLNEYKKAVKSMNHKEEE